MTAPRQSHVVLYDLGTACLDLIAALSRAGFAISVIEPDRDDAVRVGDILGRRLPDLQLRVDSGVPGYCDVFVCHAAAAGHAPPGALVVVLNGPQGFSNVPAPARTVALNLLDPRLIEVSLGRASAELRGKALDFANALNVPVIQIEGGAFTGTILQDTALALADRLLLVGITPWELDEALEKAGFVQGVLKAQDHIGLEVAFARRRAAGTDLLVADRMVREGRLGRSIGVGWYRYPGGGGAVIDPLMEDMIVEEARFARIDQLPLAATEASDALIVGVMNAASAALQSGVTSQELDQLAFYALGLPDLTARARSLGQGPLTQQLRNLHAVHPELWAPSPFLPLLF
ncbi:3-hydroxyacyl-CoA dehydrogenase, C-terminal domain [Sulfitobacter marinus]|uniref:3-hydroxyacyl-CoA dehydrogenase, C-terminal domain n=1 Tax=Sulfitobacter marinus TaxID=394264 RepID=A0A1I6VJ77_9RHOB|nr:3-hydroxyacyl-CoA dehydrogenase family protein [Sulfitobacter marinus]SFT13681.1 3-hydroxyacyl-CoA dehydrogenase, C-terminal domain [Sulfitobacter marinus]